MPLSRRSFLRSASLGAAAAATLEFPAGLFAGAPAEPARPRASKFILLNSNENAYGPLPSAAATMRKALDFANRYPDKQYDGLVERIAAYHHVQPHQVLTGCGSTELLRVAPTAFLNNSQKKLITATPTFEAIGWYATGLGASVVTVPLTKDYAHDLDAMLASAGDNAGLVYICNPNNPTASLTPRKQLDQFIAALPANVYVLVDEAYHHFAMGASGYASYLDEPVNDPRVIVARTFSKIYGMAGIRLGYAVAAPETIQKMRPFSQQDNVNMVAALSGITSLDDQAAMHAAVARNARDRDEFMRQASARGLRPIPSYCNFLMMDTGRPVQKVIDHFKQRGIMVGRRFPGMETFVRVSLGTPEQMMAFWQTWDGMPKST